jgi:hypothetical protein
VKKAPSEFDVFQHPASPDFSPGLFASVILSPGAIHRDEESLLMPPAQNVRQDPSANLVGSPQDDTLLLESAVLVVRNAR